MTAPEGSDPPPLVEQEMLDGTWVPQLNAFMTWEPADGDYTIAPRGPIDPQVHDEGMWAPAAGNAMKWVPNVPPPPEDAPPIPIVAGDEQQPGDEVELNGDA